MESRITIINHLLERLQSEESVLAFFEGGSIAFNYHDKYSDIDAYIICEKVEDASQLFNIVEEIIEQLGGALDVYTQPWSEASKIHQRFYRLKEFSPFLLLDLAIISQDAPELFLDPKIHGEAKVYFDKTDITKNQLLDKTNVDIQLIKEKNRLRARYKMFSIFFDKELLRKRYIQAVDFYFNFILGTLVGALRIEHSPYHYNFRVAGIYRDLPEEIINKLEILYYIKDNENLGCNAQIADTWIREIFKNW